MLCITGTLVGSSADGSRLGCPDGALHQGVCCPHAQQQPQEETCQEDQSETTATTQAAGKNLL